MTLSKYLFVLATIILTRHAAAAALNPADILISAGQFSSQNAVYEYTLSGTRVQTFIITAPAPVDTSPRDAFVGSDNNIYIFNGTFTPALTTLNPITGALSSDQGIGFSVANNLTYGGVAAIGNYAFVPDMNTGGSPNVGVVRFDLINHTSQRFQSTTEFTRVTIGNDGLLYGINDSGYFGWPLLYVWDPLTMNLIHTVGLVVADVRAVAISNSGEIYASDWDGYIRDFSPDGTLVKSLHAPDATYDLALMSNGTIIASSWGQVVVTNTSLTSYTEWSVPNTGPLFVGLTTPPIPEPSALMLALPIAATLLTRRRDPK